MENTANHQDIIDHSPYLASLEEKLANIEAEKLAIEAKEAALRRSIASIRELIALESGELVPSRSDGIIIPKRAFKGLPMIDALEKCLKMVKTGRTVRQLADYLKEGGFSSVSKFFVSNVRSALKRQGPVRGIVRRGNEYWLAEWPYTPKEQESDNYDDEGDEQEGGDIGNAS